MYSICKGIKALGVTGLHNKELRLALNDDREKSAQPLRRMGGVLYSIKDSPQRQPLITNKTPSDNGQ